MFRLSARHAAHLFLILPALALTSCGGGFGTLLTVPNSVVVADVNGDGVLDVAVAVAQIDETGLTQKPGLLEIILNSKASPGTFAAAVGYPTTDTPPSGLAVGDLSGTGSHDMVVANINSGTLSVFMETSSTSGTYGAATSIAVGGQPNDVQIADINGDGLPDLVVADNLGKVEYLLQDPAHPGTFLAAVSLPIDNPAVDAEGLVARGITVAVGDLNGDGAPDLAVTSFDANGDYGQVTVYFQDPNNRGTFLATPTNISAPGEPSQIRIADVNQDGANDMVIALQGLGANAGVVTGEIDAGAMIILQNAGAAGTFAAPVVYAAPSGVISVAVGDLNGDGLPDLAMCGLYPLGTGTVATLMQDPNNPGQFLGAAQLLAAGQPVSIAIGDMNNDGLPDLVTADATSAEWYKNQASAIGSFVNQGQIGL